MRAVDPRAHGVAVRLGSHQLHLQPVPVPGSVIAQRVLIGRSRHGNIEDAAVPEISHGHAAAVGQQVGAGGAADLPKVPSPLLRRWRLRSQPCQEVGRSTGIEEAPVLYSSWRADHVVQEVQLDLGVRVVVDPAVGGVDILPAVVVEVGEDRAPEPADRVGGRLQVTSSKVPSPRLRSSVLPEAICWNTSTNPKPDCRKISM
jgi:hypothetical protein